MKSTRVAGLWIIGVGLLHCTIFLWFGRTALGSIAAEGFWNTIDPIRGRQVLFWALLTGLFGFLLGQLALWVSNQGKALPAFLGWELLALTLVCGILMPFSGGWLFAVPGALIAYSCQGEHGSQRKLNRDSSQAERSSV